MFRTTVAAAVLVAGGLAFSTVGANAQMMEHPMTHYHRLHSDMYKHPHHYHHSRSYGTGYHGRGTATGGPVGGLPSRN